MAVTRPGQREWTPDGGGTFLIDVLPGGGSGLHIGPESDLDGWWPTATADDLPTIDGVSPGLMIPAGMYPSIVGLRAESAEALAALVASMPAHGTTTGTLTWMSEATEVTYSADVEVRRCEPREAPPRPFHLVDVMWVVARPGEVDAGS